MTTFDKLVDGATKIKLAPPKPKYVEPILMATADGERSDGFRTIMKALARRLQDSAWTIVYKSLIVIHIMIREGEPDVCIKYLANHLSILDINIGKGGKFISNGGELNQVYSYAKYLTVRANEYSKTGHDFIKETKKPFGSWSSSDKSSILRELSVEKGLLRETESVQNQIDALIRCSFREPEVNNDLVVLSFRMLTTDLISLYQCLNEGVLNLLEHFFDLSKTDASRAFEIYEKFTRQTKKVIDFLRVAKHLESVTKLRVPTIKHAQTSLTSSLKEYLEDTDFEINRRQYLAEKEFKRNNVENIDNKEQQQKEFYKKDQFQVQANAKAEAEAEAQAQAQAQAELQAQAQAQAQLQAQQLDVQAFQQQQLLQQQLQLQAQMTSQAQPQVPIQTRTSLPIIGSTNTGVMQQTTEFNPFSNMNAFSVQPAQFNTSEVPLPQMLNIQNTQSYAQNPLGQMNFSNTVPMNLQTPVHQSNSTFITTPLSQPRVLSNNFTGNGFGGYGSNAISPQSNNNPFGNLNSPTRANSTITNSKNPFGNTRFSTSSTTTPFTTQAEKETQKQLQYEATGTIKPISTGTNPFRLETNVFHGNDNNGHLSTVSEIRHQPTAGGLERLPTIPVFPETQNEARQQQLQTNAGIQLNQQVMQQQIAANPFSQQATGIIQHVSTIPTNFTGNIGVNNGNFVGQPVINGQHLSMGQLSQPQQQMYSNVYNGPNLLG